METTATETLHALLSQISTPKRAPKQCHSCETYVRDWQVYAFDVNFGYKTTRITVHLCENCCGGSEPIEQIKWISSASFDTTGAKGVLDVSFKSPVNMFFDEDIEKIGERDEFFNELVFESSQEPTLEPVELPASEPVCGSAHDYYCCTECGMFLGEENPRQLCGKTRCYNLSPKKRARCEDTDTK
jgi:hypothetical protein